MIMKPIVTIGGFILFTTGVLSGCSFMGEGSKTDVSLDEDAPIAERVENFDNYQKVKTANIARGNELGLELCKKHVEFEEQVRKGKIVKQTLFMKDGYHLEVYKTENYSSLTDPMLSDYNTKCAQGESSVRIIKAFPEALIWGQPSCLASASPNSSDPTYQSFLNCQAMAEDLQEYIAS